LDLITTTFDVAGSYQLPQGCTDGHLVEWNGTGWGCLAPEDPGYANVIVVAKSGGDFDSIQGALDSIADATSENRYLVWVAPGIYSEKVEMNSWVDIEGAGQKLTTIKSEGSPTPASATVIAAAHSELRFLTVSNTGGDALSIAILSEVDDFSINRVMILASGASVLDRGIYFSGSTMRNRVQNSHIKIFHQSNSGAGYGIRVYSTNDTSGLEVDSTNISVTGSTSSRLVGLRVFASASATSTITASNVTIIANNDGPGAADAIMSYGTGATINIENSHLESVSAPGAGLYCEKSNIIAHNISLSSIQLGVYARGPSDPANVIIDNSIIVGGSYAAQTLGGTGNAISFGSSLLDGSISAASGDTITCVNSYDEKYTNANGFDSCP